jgi:ABC-type polysaccharide/polyol phosphate transport system ATPase subunit
MPAPIIEVNHVTKEYRLGQNRSLRDSLLSFFGNNSHSTRFNALDDVDFKIEQGEVVGIIGANGAGKSTLLKLLAGVAAPTKGKVAVHGRIAPLIEVGAGFNPELTGRENIYLNGSILGMSRAEIKRKFDEIVQFAELEKFIDTPIKRYSSGMAVRLGFSVATSVNADILLIDEVLAVGDLAFQRKCFERMENILKDQEKTMILVSHNIRQIERLCRRAILFDFGKIISDSNSKSSCQLFYDRSNAKIASQESLNLQTGRNIHQTGEIELKLLTLADQEGNPAYEVTTGEPITIRGIFNASREFSNPEIVYGFHTTDFIYISSLDTTHLDGRTAIRPGENIIECHIPSLPLVPGVYYLRAGILDRFHNLIYYAEMLSGFSVKNRDRLRTSTPHLGFVHIPAEWKF